MFKKFFFASLLSLALTSASMGSTPVDWSLNNGDSMILPTDGAPGYNLIVNKGPGTIILYFYHYEKGAQGNIIKVVDSVKLLKKGDFHSGRLDRGCHVDIVDFEGDDLDSEGIYIFVP